MIDRIENAMLLYSLLFAAAGFVLGLYYNSRQIALLEDKVRRLKQSLSQRQGWLVPPSGPAEPAPLQRSRA